MDVDIVDIVDMASFSPYSMSIFFIVNPISTNYSFKVLLPSKMVFCTLDIDLYFLFTYMHTFTSIYSESVQQKSIPTMEDFCDQSKSLPLLSSESVSKQKYLEIKTQFFSKADLYPSKSIWSNVDFNQNYPKGHPRARLPFMKKYTAACLTNNQIPG